jgi:hypothetical protein
MICTAVKLRTEILASFLHRNLRIRTNIQVLNNVALTWHQQMVLIYLLIMWILYCINGLNFFCFYYKDYILLVLGVGSILVGLWLPNNSHGKQNSNS